MTAHHRIGRLCTTTVRSVSIMAALTTCNPGSRAADSASLPGYYVLSYALAAADTQNVQGIVRISRNQAAQLTGRAWLPDIESRDSTLLALHNLQLTSRGALTFAIGTPDVAAAFRSDPRADGLWTGTIRSTRFGTSTEWPATLAKQRGLLGGLYLFDMHYAIGSQQGWDQGTLSLADTSPRTLGVRGRVERFLADPDSDSPYLRQGRVLDVNDDLSLSPALSFAFDLPLQPARVHCSGDAVTVTGLEGHCAFGPSPNQEIPFTLWRIPEDWEPSGRMQAAAGDTLYLASYLQDRLFKCTYVTPRYARVPAANNMTAYVPCFGISGHDALWSEPGLVGLMPERRGANLFALGLVSPSILLAIDSGSAVYAYSRDSLSTPTFLYRSAAGLRFVGGDPFSAIVYDHAGRLLRIGRDLKVNSLPPFPKDIVDSTYVVAATAQDSVPVVVGLSRRRRMPTVVLRYNGTEWDSRTFGDGPGPDWRDAVELRDTLFAFRSSFRERQLYTLVVKELRLDSIVLQSPEPSGPIGTESLGRLAGRLVVLDGTVHVLTEFGRVLYRIQAGGRLVPILDLRVPTDSVPIPSREILDISDGILLLDGGIQLARRGGL